MSAFSVTRKLSGGGVPLHNAASAASAAMSATTMDRPNQAEMHNDLLVGLGKWSVFGDKKQLPRTDQVRAIHVYDFDNTLFLSPLPNPKLWAGQTLGKLQSLDVFTNGGWWHDSRILAATGDGVEKEEPRAWEGWWNENIVELVKLSMSQKDTLTVLLTGRSVSGFADLILRMVAAKKLEFDMVCLKPQIGPMGQKFTSTKHFKTTLLEHIMDTYFHTEEITIYEDRVNHVQGFREFFETYNNNIVRVGRQQLLAEVVHVAALTHVLDPTVEVREIQIMVKNHNQICQETNVPSFSPLHIKKHVFFTGYLIDTLGTKLLLDNFPIMTIDDDQVRVLANNITITPRRAPNNILNKVGGIGAEYTFEVVSMGNYDNRVWAAQVRPVDRSTKAYTESGKLVVVLGHRRGAKPADANLIDNWEFVSQDRRVRFTTKVGEKVLLKIESEEETALFERDRAAGTYNHGGNHDDRRGGRNQRYNSNHRGGHNNNHHYNSNQRDHPHNHHQGYHHQNEHHGYSSGGRGRGGDRGGYRGNKRRGNFDDRRGGGGKFRREFYDRDRIE